MVEQACQNCKYLRSVGCGNKIAMYCPVRDMIIMNPDITDCNRWEWTEDES